MGRKIPARKHFGIRDPVKQNEERFALIKDKINNPPEKRDYQKVSHSFARFIKLKEDAKKQSTKPALKKKLKRITNQNEDKPAFFSKQNKKKPETRNEKEFSNLHQRSNESDHSFMKRVNRVTKESVEEAKFEAKYGVDVIRNEKTGEIKLKKRPSNEIDERLKQNVANLKKKGNAAKPVVIPAEERKKLVKAMMQEKKQKEDAEKKPAIDEYKRDVIKFGEVAQAPPQLPTPRLAKKAETVPRPGQKPLILRTVISKFANTDEESDHSFMKRVNRVTKESVEEAKFEAKYGVDVIRNEKTGEIKLKKRPSNEIDERLKQNVANLKKKGNAAKPVVIPAEERKKLVKAMMQEKKQKEDAEKKPAIDEYKRDVIKFGEVAQAPPQLPTPRLAKKAETVPRPGQKPLILRTVISKFANTDEETPKQKSSIPKSNVKKAGTSQPKDNSLKGKRKDLSMNMRNMIETEQKNAVKLYKEIKKNQRTQNKT